MAVDIHRIAEETGYSTSTVSKALNGYSDIAESTREKILSAARELGYEANSSARSLRTKKIEKIGLIIITKQSMQDYIGEYYFNVMKSVAFATGEYGYNLLLYAYKGDQLEKVRQVCRSREIGGLILTGGGDTDSLLSYCGSARMPIVLLNRQVSRPGIISVCSDNEQGGYEMTSHLIAGGRRRIAYIGSADDYETTRGRLEGYRRALNEHGIPFDRSMIRYTDSSHEKILSAARELIGPSDYPDAVFTFNDRYALKVMSYIKSLGLDVPGDIALGGFDDIRSDLIASPTLSTVRQPLQELGQRAVEAIIEHIQKDSHETVEITLPIELVERDSTKRKE